MWQSGDYGAIATQIHVVAENLMTASNPEAGSSVLDVAGGTGNAAIAAARSNCVVTCTDYAPTLLERARERRGRRAARDRRRRGRRRGAALEDASYDVVTSVFGAMSAPDQERPRASSCASAARRR